MVRARPQFAPDMLRAVFGLELPEGRAAKLGSENHTNIRPTELLCDATVMLEDPTGGYVHGIIVESQLRYDGHKALSWPAYLASLRLRHKCPVTLLVICPNQSTARACEAPIRMGHPGWVLKPLTFYPGMLPPITDVEAARKVPELAALSAPHYADGPDGEAVLDAAAVALGFGMDPAYRMYYDVMRAQLSDAARELMEKTVDLKNYEWQSKWAKTHIAEGEAKAILLVLEGRGVEVPNDVRERVTGCTDTEQLERWVRRAGVVDKAEDLLD
ncbi:hypothetical protein BZB76_2476 [Actinomadura pelletieri DSM 43383]|uniref:Uncharacterized protein n=2 Tax=Actinomadura pelletieri TaxID=111805 RepID=A0A495QUK8_9ACTN|nr:hypothetical protein BZB76_2476 [Actinomadura pelletieri DSM 43383]